MKTFASFCIILAVAIAGCASPDAEPTPTPTPTATATPTPSATPTPTAIPTVTPTGELPPAPVECHGDYVTEDSTATRLNMTELTFTIQEPSSSDPCYAFVGPANATAGWNVITLTNPGQEFHIMPMYFIGTHTMADFGAAMAVAETQGTPEWAVASGAVGGVTGGQNGSVAIDLQAGNYVYFCPIGGHMFQGMMGMLAVENATGNETMGMEPMADVSITLVDYNFTIPNMSANMSVIKVTNNGTEDHEMPLVLLAGNATAMEFIEALEQENPTGPPPGALVGGVNVIAPGQTVYVLRDLSSGERYGVACFVASPAHGGAPHIAIGPMVAEFEVA